ncbi:MAG: acetate--CoA ligase family protein [Shinella sp.]|uniref:acetate--CoA ligase family protein n=1 Tax=Shinella sp. TaxID=1870904 RepID=UPI003C766CD3
MSNVTVARGVPGASDLADALLRPRSIVLVGASGDESKANSRPQRYLRQHGFEGDIHLVNRSRTTLFGERAYPDVKSVGQPIDHALLMVPAKDVIGAVKECGEAGVTCVTILSDGFAEAGEAGRKHQDDLMKCASEVGVRVLGPNSIGLINVHRNVALSANAALSASKLLPGRLGLISQSGSAIGALLSRAHARDIGFSTLVSVGNEADIGIGEIGRMLVEQDETDCVLLFLETIRNGTALAEMARYAFERGKPVIAYLLGRSRIAQQISNSHTGALTTDFVAMETFLRDSGIMRVDFLESLFELPPLVAGRKPPKGRRVTIVTTTGGGGAMVADRLGQSGIDVVAPDDATVDRLAARGVNIKSGPLIDLTLAGTRPEIFGAVLDELTASDACDLIIPVAGSSAQFHPENAVAPILSPRANAKPMATFLAPEAAESLRLLANGNVAAFRTPEACADAVRAYLDWRQPRALPADDLLPAQTQAAIAKALQAGGLNELRSIEILRDVGVPTVDCRVFATLADLNEGAHDIRFPVVAKVLSKDIQHKTEAGGVVLGITDADHLKQAAETMLARFKSASPNAAIEGILVQPMVKGLTEVLIGFQRVPNIGPVVTVAAGGIMVDIHQDFACRMAPVDTVAAMEMIDAVKSLAVIRGYRNLPLGDCEALAQAISALSRLALFPSIESAEVNPLMVLPKGQGVVAVDGLVIVDTP